jgi:hypothetical protein
MGTGMGRRPGRAIVRRHSHDCGGAWRWFRLRLSPERGQPAANGNRPRKRTTSAAICQWRRRRLPKPGRASESRHRRRRQSIMAALASRPQSVNLSRADLSHALRPCTIVQSKRNGSVLHVFKAAPAVPSSVLIFVHDARWANNSNNNNNCCRVWLLNSLAQAHGGRRRGNKDVPWSLPCEPPVGPPPIDELDARRHSPGRLDAANAADAEAKVGQQVDVERR